MVLWPYWWGPISQAVTAGAEPGGGGGGRRGEAWEGRRPESGNISPANATLSPPERFPHYLGWAAMRTENSVLTPLLSGFPLPPFLSPYRRLLTNTCHVICQYWLPHVASPITLYTRHPLNLTEVETHWPSGWRSSFSMGYFLQSRPITQLPPLSQTRYNRPGAWLTLETALLTVAATDSVSRVLTSVRHLDHDGIWDGIYAGSGLVAVVPHLSDYKAIDSEWEQEARGTVEKAE